MARECCTDLSGLG